MRNNKFIIELLKHFVFISLLCFLVSHVDAQIMVPVSVFESNGFQVNEAGGLCEVGFRTYGQPNENLVKVMKDMVNHQLTQGGITWISATDFILDDYNVLEDYYSGILVFEIVANPTCESREIILDNGNNVRASIIQSGIDPVNVYTVTSDINSFYAFPGRKTKVTLSGSQVGVSYYIDNDTIHGTGFPITFEKVFTEGVYYVIAKKDKIVKTMIGNVNITYYSFLKAGLCTEQEDISGVLPPISIRPGCGLYSLNVPFIDLMDDIQKEQLDNMIEEINNGKSNCYPGLRLERSGSQILLMTGPNIKGESWESDVFLSLDNGRGGKQYRIRVLIDPIAYPVECFQLLNADSHNDNYTLKLNNAQLNVKYRLFKDSVFVQEKIGFIIPVEFNDISEGGTYRVEACYWDTVVPMNGTVYIDGGVGRANYVKESIYIHENDPVSTYVYYDSQGRVIQTRVAGIGGDGQDVITPREYDNTGREPRLYLSYGIANQGFRKNAITEQDTFYLARFGKNHHAFSDRVFDNSPDDRVIESSLPSYETRLGGGHTMKSIIRKNKSTDNIKRYILSGSSLTLTGIYGTNSLMVMENTDGDGQVSREYIDNMGNVVCKAKSGLSTYYIFDDIGQLRYIVPPMQDSLFTSGTKTLTELNKYCYYMEYDLRGRLYKQYVPGAGYSVYLYDKRDRRVLEQDAKMRETDRWHFTKYDSFNRPVISGICTGSEAMYVDSLSTQRVFGEERGGVLHGYTNHCVPSNVTSADCMIITYYDDYTWIGQSAVVFSEADTLGHVRSDRVRGQVTGTKTKVLGNEADQWLLSATYYDSYYRAIQTVSQLYPSGTEIVSNRHDFAGNVIQVKVKQTVNGTTNAYMKYMDYDGHGRLLSTRMQILGDATNGLVTLSQIKYDELGRIASETLHNGREVVTSVYDVRAREAKRSSSRFSYELGFEKSESTISSLVTPRYNGNVSHVRWGNGTLSDRGYTYLYDSFGQLTAATYIQKNGATWNTTTKYGEKEIRYDRNGNLKHVKRTNTSGNVLHDIEYAYSNTGNGNAISNVKINGVSSGGYIYDEIGNLTIDGRRGVNIRYNELNLPCEISDGSSKVSYIYSAAGEKLARQVGSSLTCYRGGVMVYNGNTLDYIFHPRGVIRKVSTGYVYNYFLTDHLGSTRVVLEASGNTLAPVQTTDYYPFGLAFSYNNLDKNKYLYGGKELQDMTLNGEMLNLLDFGSRFYDPVLARWFCQDPALQQVSPYGYCGNNPVACVDPDGEFFGTIFNFMKDFVVNTFGRVWTEGINAWTDKKNWHSTTMAWKVDVGLFKGNFGQILSRLTWESPQTALGHVTNTLATSLNLVKSVSSWGGATAVETYKSDWGAFTLGSYILGDRGLQADPNNSLFQHEYGHYLQSQHWGPSYLSRGALPSLFDTFGRGGDHQYHPIEQDANMRAFKYFNKNVEGFYKTQEEYDPKIEGGWNFAKNPLDIYGNGYSKYVDYHDADQMSLVNKLKVSSNLWEQFVGTSIFADPLPTLGYGLRNHVHYNKHKYTIY